jgi:Cu/Ag efflux pump CusA
MLISIILAAVVLGLLMGSWRTAIIALAAISLSFVCAELLLRAAGIPLSMIVVGGLLMASGVIVHDSIIDVENVLHRLRAPQRDGRSGFMVVVRAMLETRRPMLYASLIVVLAVLPVLFMYSRSAAFFAPMAWAYIAAVSISMLVALIVTPALAAVLLANTPPTPTGGWVINRLARPFDSIVGRVIDRVSSAKSRTQKELQGAAI